MDTKSFSGAIQLKADAEGVFRATFARLNVVDLDGDVTLPGAFDVEPVKIARWGHNWGDLPVGKGVIASDSTAAWVDGEFFLDTLGGKDTYTTVKRLGDLQEWSYGFKIVDASFGQFGGQDVRFLKRLQVFEVSPVMLGAGVGTRTDSIKGFGLSEEDHFERVRVAVQEYVHRLSSGSEARRKEGRAISSSRRERIGVMRDALHSHADELDALLKETAPPEKAADSMALYLEFQRTLATLRS